MSCSQHRGRLFDLRWCLPLSMVAALSGCIALVRVSPASGVPAGATICVVRNASVWDSFLHEYLERLRQNGYQPQAVTAGQAESCEYRSTYAAAREHYLVVAEIKVFRGNDLLGAASYRANRGKLNHLVPASRRVQEMADALLSPVD